MRDAGSDNLIYLYCITGREPELSELRFPDSALYSICHKGVYAVACNVEKAEFEEEQLKWNMADMDWVKNRARLHESVIEGVLKDSSVIPFRFGTVFFSEDSVKAMIERHEPDFKKQLKYFRNKEEWGVKMYYDERKLRDFLDGENDKLIALRNGMVSSDAGKIFLLKKQRELVLTQLLHKNINQYCELCFSMLSAISLDACMNKLLPREITGRNEDMIFNMAFLIQKLHSHQFIGVIQHLEEETAGKGLSVDCTGPWPPYNFCISVDKPVIAHPSTPTSPSWGPNNRSGPQHPLKLKVGLSLLEGGAR